MFLLVLAPIVYSEKFNSTNYEYQIFTTSILKSNSTNYEYIFVPGQTTARINSTNYEYWFGNIFPLYAQLTNIQTLTNIEPLNNSHDNAFRCGFANGKTDCDLLKSLVYDFTSFTYKVVNFSNPITNCSLWLKHNGGDWEENKTDSIIEVNINQTFNVSLKTTGEQVQWKVGCYDSLSASKNSTAFNFTLFEFYDNNISINFFDTYPSRTIKYLDNVTILEANVSGMFELNDNITEVNFSIMNPLGYKLLDSKNGTKNYTLDVYNFADRGSRWFSLIEPFLINQTGDWEFKVEARNSGGQSRIKKFNITINDDFFILPLQRAFTVVASSTENFTQVISLFQNNTNADISYNISAYMEGNYHNISFNFDTTTQYAVSGINAFSTGSNIALSDTEQFNLTFYFNRSSEAIPDGQYFGNVTITRNYLQYSRNFTFNITLNVNPPASNISFVDYNNLGLCSSGSCDNTSSISFGDTVRFHYALNNSGAWNATDCELSLSNFNNIQSFSETIFNLPSNTTKFFNITFTSPKCPPNGCGDFYKGKIDVNCIVNSLGHVGTSNNPPELTLFVVSDGTSGVQAGGGGGGSTGGVVEIIEEIIEDITKIPALLREGDLGAARILGIVFAGLIILFILIAGVKEKNKKKRRK